MCFKISHFLNLGVTKEQIVRKRSQPLFAFVLLNSDLLIKQF